MADAEGKRGPLYVEKDAEGLPLLPAMPELGQGSVVPLQGEGAQPEATALHPIRGLGGPPDEGQDPQPWRLRPALLPAREGLLDKR